MKGNRARTTGASSPCSRTFATTSRRCKAHLTDGRDPPTLSLSNELDSDELKNRVRELRAERGLSQGELAAAVDVSRQTINSIEQERYTPSLPLALALARFFTTTVEEMFDASH
jgi:putative transcriptional regulator